MSNIDKRALREAAEKALPAMKRLLMMPNDELFDEALLNVDGDVDAANAFNLLTGPETVLALLDEVEAAERRIAEMEAMQGKPVMFIDGDISPSDADKLAAVIREFNEEAETPAARMARIIRENPHPTNMCDMPTAGIGKGE
ncbi:TPA: ead/Ea22-like family protein [Citrobacter sedlakii]|nr:ead/Ea22-like family protein [Citrobacter sedlakii]